MRMRRGRAERGAGPDEGQADRASGSGPVHPGRARLGRVGVQVRAAGERESGVGPCDIHSVYGPGWSLGRVCVFCSRVKRIWLLSAASAADEATCAPRGKWP
jgi:hypothetical protein